MILLLVDLSPYPCPLIEVGIKLESKELGRFTRVAKFGNLDQHPKRDLC